MWGRTYRFTALTGAMGEGEGGVASQPPHPHARALVELLLDAGADPNDAQGLYNTMFRPDNHWLHLLLDRGLTARDRINWKTGNRVRNARLPARSRGAQGLRRPGRGWCSGTAPIRAGRSYYDGRTHYDNALLNGFGDVAEMLQRAGAEPAELSLEDRFRAACMSGDEAAARAALETAPRGLDDPETLHAARFGGQRGRRTVRAEPGRGPERHRRGTARPRCNHAGWKRPARGGRGPGRARRASAA